MRWRPKNNGTTKMWVPSDGTLRSRWSQRTNLRVFVQTSFNVLYTCIYEYDICSAPMSCWNRSQPNEKIYRLYGIWSKKRGSMICFEWYEIMLLPAGSYVTNDVSPRWVPLRRSLVFVLAVIRAAKSRLEVIWNLDAQIDRRPSSKHHTFFCFGSIALFTGTDSTIQ